MTVANRTSGRVTLQPVTPGGTAAAQEAARIVLECGAVYTRSAHDPFFFSSGWASPVFIDLKRLISMPAARSRLMELALGGIDAVIGNDACDQIAGCELAGVPFAAMAADRRGLPLVVVLKQARGFGRLAQFEGAFEPGARTLLLDDLTTDGRTKATFKAALERAEAKVVGVYVLLNYAIFPASPEIHALTTLPDIVSVARRDGLLGATALEEIGRFADDAPLWSKRHGGIAGL